VESNFSKWREKDRAGVIHQSKASKCKGALKLTHVCLKCMQVGGLEGGRGFLTCVGAFNYFIQAKR